jgi:hypothetical protein
MEVVEGGFGELPEFQRIRRADERQKREGRRTEQRNERDQPQERRIGAITS